MDIQTSPEGSFIGKHKVVIGQFIRFAIIGGINTGVDFAVLNLLSWITGVNKGNGVIWLNLVSFSVAVINSYFLNKFWAFKDQSSSEQGKKFVSFITISIIGAVINTSIVRFISTNVDPMFGLSAQLWLNVAKLFATGVSLIWNFIGYKLVVFKK